MKVLIFLQDQSCQREPSYCEVVIDELRPSKQVSEPIKSSQFATEKLLALVVGNGIRPSQIVHWGHHSQTWGEGE